MGGMTWQFGFALLRYAAGMWGAFVLVAVGLTLTGIYDPIRDDRMPPERLPYMWAWWGFNVTVSIALIAWATLKIRRLRKVPPNS
jgi:hypothetical protein